jgi:hypothetical protein
MLGRPRVPGPVASPAGQVPQDRGGSAREAAYQAGEGGVHAHRAGQRPAHLGRPGQSGVVPVLGQVAEDVGDVGGGELQPGVAEHQAGGLPSGPHQRAGAAGGAEAEGEELVAGTGERRRVRWPMSTWGHRRPAVMPHRHHPPT